MIIFGSKSVKKGQKRLKKATNCKVNNIDNNLNKGEQFSQIIAFDKYQICQDIFFFKKPDVSPICGFFQHFLALFDTFTTRYDHSDTKFEFSGYFYTYKHFI